ncbi:MULTISPECIES: hypothetical protein [Kocuria]|uniref:hypothetical protein n=1 Tax=Kocuria TaxID=57493 RepID=UPI0006612015|nr:MULTISPECIES: hypothetical protein [Kocuria]MCT1366942.1 hypothetical protein [Rothia sp. p3-SID1597]RUQ20053.1 hypothetical protein D8M21_10265 [Kocuria sp. HSID16901]
MAQRPKRGIKADIKGPLIIAAVLAVVAFVAVTIFATGGTNNQPEFRLALSVAGCVFVVTLVVCATLIIVEKPNDEELGQGTGVNRRSADLYAAAKARKDAREREAREREAKERGEESSSSSGSEESGPQYGKRAHPEEHN